jgi:cytochrome P450
MGDDLRDDLLSPSASADPFPVFAALRERDPVHFSEAHQAWLITRYDDVSAAFQNKAFSSDRVRPLLSSGADGPGGGAGGPGGGSAGTRERSRSSRSEESKRLLALMADWMVVSDPPAHTRLRKLASGAFKSQRISAMDRRITELVDELLDEFMGEPGPKDLVEGLAYPLPATVIAAMLGAPLTDRDLFREWSDELALVAFGVGGDDREERHERALRGLDEMAAYFRDLVAVRRADPGEDMLSELLAPTDGDRLDDTEIVGMCALLLFAGHETTTNSIANSVHTLLSHPDQLARLRTDPGLINHAVEELLRFDGPIKVLNRWVVADTEVGGRTIRTGERVHLVLGGANRDPDKFAHPDEVDLARQPNQHVAFGRGIHACIGAQLARLETRVAVGRIVERLPGLALAETPEWRDILASRSMYRLMVTHA